MASENVTNYDHIFKIILVGDNGVGKSSIIRRFCEGGYTQDMDTTIGVDFYLSEIEVDGKKIKVKIWDTAGSEKYMSISAVYYRKADGVIFVFDMTRPRSFTDIVSVWMNAVEAQESGCPEAIKLLVGNKSDLSPEVDVSQIKRYSELHEMTFLQSSAKDNHNVQHIFTRLADLIIQEKEKSKLNSTNRTDSVQLTRQGNARSQGGCRC